MRSAEELADELTWSGSLTILDVTVDHDPWFGSPEVYVTLVDGATDAQAREVWCKQILAMGVPWHMVRVERPRFGGEWLPPKDCTNPNDIPAFRPGPT